MVSVFEVAANCALLEPAVCVVRILAFSLEIALNRNSMHGKAESPNLGWLA